MSANAGECAIIETKSFPGLRSRSCHKPWNVCRQSWSSTRHYGNNPADEELRRGLEDWCVDDPWFDTAQEDCRFMHCLPVRRGVVVADRVLDGPRSVVIQEARNRMYAQMAVLHQMLAG